MKMSALGQVQAGLRKLGTCTGGLALSVALSLQTQAEPAYPWQVESSITAESGSYGTDQTTDLLYWPFTIRRNLDAGDVSLTIPWLDLEAGDGQTVVDGTVIRGSGYGGSGLGDAVLKGRYHWIEQTEQLPFVDLIARLKLPLADEDKGLGTGEVDAGLGFDVTRRFQRDNLWFAGMTYTFMGDPPGVDYDNRVDLEAGIGRDVLPGLLICSMYNFRSAVSPGSDDAHSISFLANHRTTERVRIFVMLEFGLTDGAPDQSLTVGGSYRFR